MNRWQHDRMVEDQEREDRARLAARVARGETGAVLSGSDGRWHEAVSQASDLERITRNAQVSISILERRLHAAQGVLVRMRESIQSCNVNGAVGHAAALKDHADDLARALEAT